MEARKARYQVLLGVLLATGCGDSDSTNPDAASTDGDAAAILDAAPGPDSDALFWVVSHAPLEGATDVPVTAFGSSHFRVLVKFNLGPELSSIININVAAGELSFPTCTSPEQEACLGHSVGMDDLTISTINVVGGLSAATTYVVTAKGGADGVISASGDLLAGDYSFSFTTAP